MSLPWSIDIDVVLKSRLYSHTHTYTHTQHTNQHCKVRYVKNSPAVGIFSNGRSSVLNCRIIYIFSSFLGTSASVENMILPCKCVKIRLITCMYVCMYVCVCVYVCMHACMHVCMYACMYVSMYVCMYVCMCACMYAAHVCIFVVSQLLGTPYSVVPSTRTCHNRNSFNTRDKIRQ